MADICPPVSGIGPCDEPSQCISFNLRPLDCLTDSVSVCLDEPIDVVVTNTGTISVEQKHPGVPGTVVPGSRWHTTGFASLLGSVTIASPIPAGNQRVVCDWLDLSLVAISLSLLAGSSHPTVRDGGVGGTILWQYAFGLLGTIAIGATYSHSENPILVSSLGNQLTYQLPATLSIFDMTLNFGGYIVEV